MVGGFVRSTQGASTATLVLPLMQPNYSLEPSESHHRGMGGPQKKKKRHVPGVDVMITIFCDFRQFSAKKLAFFSKTNVMIKILHNLAVFSRKRQFFAEFFDENI
jgi:hypothetical protein